VDSLEQLAENARKVTALGDGSTGIYLTGNNGGSIGFTIFPSIWASGAEVLDEEGTEVLSEGDEFIDVFQTFNELFQEGAISPTAREETGTTRDEVFAGGKVAYLLGSNSVITNVPDSDLIEVGVQPMPGLTGGSSTYVGGDVIGIASTSENQDAAWDFLAWSLDDETQIDVVAQGGFLVSRSDLADNDYSAADARIVTLNSLVSDGHIPFAMNYGQTFSDANGPWLTAARGALFDPAGAEAAFTESKKAIDSALAE
jgi:multiple sugar transport system substrate-binding protein